MNWDLPKQTCFKDWNDKDSKQAGDCWRCCIAAVLGLPAAEVPHFLQMEIDSVGKDFTNCDKLTQEWLNERGFCIARIHHYVNFDYMYQGSKSPPPVIKCGPTPRSKFMHQHHAVVYVGDQMVYDPHPDNSGLTAVMDNFLIMPLPPWK